MKKQSAARRWQLRNPDRAREIQARASLAYKVRQRGAVIPPNDPKAIAQWWKNRGYS